MSKKRKPPVKQRELAREEWDFSTIPDSELDACFCYEFARASKVIAKGIAEWRKRVSGLAAIKAGWLNAPTSSWLPGTSRHSDEAEFAEYTKASCADDDANKQKPSELAAVDETVLDLVASFDEFPKVCWQLLRDVTLKSANSKNFKVPDNDDVTANPEQCLSEITVQLLTWHAMDLSACEMIQEAEQHKANAPLKLTHHLFGVSWNYRNDEIAAAFLAWLKIKRPTRYPEPQAQKKTTWIAWQKLPVGKPAALEYLGVWRRKKTCTWPEYLKKWPEDKVSRAYRIKKANQRTEGQPEKAADESRIAQLKGEQAKALEIVRFIEG